LSLSVLSALVWSQILSLMSEQSGWEVKKMREEPHEWVDILIDNCVEVWEYMEQCDEFGDASSSVREQVASLSSLSPPLSSPLLLCCLRFG
jgi:hypothetical protein